jgi:hypothetical protein
MPWPLRQMHDRVRDDLAFGILVTGRLQLHGAAFNLVEQILNLIEPAEKAVGEFFELPLGH